MSQHTPTSSLPRIEDFRIAIAVAEWNGHITGALRDGALKTLRDYGMPDKNVTVVTVPGCVIKGDTPHFDYVCQSVTQGMTSLNADCDVPVIFGVLTVNEEQQALDRAGGSLGNKGSEAAETAIKMVALNRHIDEL